MADLISKQKQIIGKMQETISLKDTLQSREFGVQFSPQNKFGASEVIRNQMEQGFASGGTHEYSKFDYIPVSGLTTHASNFYPRGIRYPETIQTDNTAEGLYSKVTNPLFSNYYQKKNEWNQLKSNQTSDFNVRNWFYPDSKIMKSGPTFRQSSFDDPVNVQKSGSKYSRSKKSSLNSRLNTETFGNSMIINSSPNQNDAISVKKSRVSRRVSMMNPAPSSRKSRKSVKSVAKSILGKSILTKRSRLNVSSNKKIDLGNEEHKSVNQSRASHYPRSQDRVDTSQ